MGINIRSQHYLESELMEFDQVLHICIDIDNIYVGIVTRQFSPKSNRVMVLDEL